MATFSFHRRLQFVCKHSLTYHRAHDKLKQVWNMLVLVVRHKFYTEGEASLFPVCGKYTYRKMDTRENGREAQLTILNSYTDIRELSNCYRSGYFDEYSFCLQVTSATTINNKKWGILKPTSPQLMFFITSQFVYGLFVLITRFNEP